MPKDIHYAVELVLSLTISSCHYKTLHVVTRSLAISPGNASVKPHFLSIYLALCFLFSLIYARDWVQA